MNMLRRDSVLRDLGDKKFDELEELAKRDERAMFVGWYCKEGGKNESLEVTNEIRARQALALELERDGFNALRDGLVGSLNNGALDRLLVRRRERIRTAVEAQRRRSKNDGGIYYHFSPPLFTEVDDIKTATSVFDGGNFYRGVLHFPGAKVPIRVKKYGDPTKFRRGIPVQRFLKRLERDGLLTDNEGRKIRINSPAYIDEKKGFVAELELEGRRLTDVLRDVRTDEERADLLEPVIRDYMEISLRATEMRDLKVDAQDARKIGHDSEGEHVTDEGTHYLENQEGKWARFRNAWPGNYVIPNQGNPVDNFMRVFALRASPHFRNKYLKKDGKFDQGGFHRLGSEGSLMSHLREGLDSFVKSDYKERKRFVVNLDANSTQVMVASDGRRTYTDWDHTYFGLLEEQLAEILLTSGISDESVLEGLVDGAYEHVKFDVGHNTQQDHEDWKRVVDKKMVEKLLARSARFVDVARKVEGIKEEGELKEFANEAYTLAMRRLDKLGENSRFTKERIREFAERHLGLEEVEDVEAFRRQSGCIGSLISTVHDRTPLEGMRATYKLASKPIDWSRVGGITKNTAIAASILGAMAAGFAGINHFNYKEKMETAAKYSGKEIALVDPHYNEIHYKLNSSIPGEMVTAPEGLRTERDYLKWAFEMNGTNSQEDTILWMLDRDVVSNARKNAVSDSKDVEERSRGLWGKSAIEAAAEGSSVDPDLIRAIVASRCGMSMDSPECIGPMHVDRTAKYFKNEGCDSDFLNIDCQNIKAGAGYLYQCVRHNEGRLADTVAEYFTGVYDYQKAQIEADSRDYIDYRRNLPLSAIGRIDSTIANYLVLKGVVASESTESDGNDE